MPAIIEGYSLLQTLDEMPETFRRAEVRRLDEVDIKYAPTFGEMYECLTQDVLDCAVPLGLGLKVVRGFAIDGSGGTTGQLDCLLLRGEGIPVPYTASKFDTSKLADWNRLR